MRIVVAMSGGVDSSVAAALLREEGHECLGLFMRNGVAAPEGGARTNGCCSAADADDARRVCAALGMPFYALDFEEGFRAVIQSFVEEYRRGRTPNPCVLCNRDLKFGDLLDYADAVGAEAIATGHYARLVTAPDGRAALARAVDRGKDQSYVLYPLARPVLDRIRLPVGGFAKSEIRALAARFGLPVAAKPDSQEICFVPGDDYRAVLRARDPDGGTPGEIVEAATGRVLGRHEGIRDFTVGQRRGLGVAAATPLYVVGLDAERARVLVGPDEATLAVELHAEDAIWSGRDAPAPGERFGARVQVRSRHEAAPAEVEGGEGGAFHVRFAQPQRAITPGQSAVVYDADAGELLLGGGVIAT